MDCSRIENMARGYLYDDLGIKCHVHEQLSLIEFVDSDLGYFKSLFVCLTAGVIGVCGQVDNANLTDSQTGETSPLRVCVARPVHVVFGAFGLIDSMLTKNATNSF